ncbi:hypothetical protein DFJ73DRAFT_869160 [Zopfochytrium polystomum]|nr:hypothetical protein DFJ73DRAFT_869160 [Zopfochytrium polystomum]
MSASDSNQYLVGSLLAFVIAVCFREHVGRIQNRHLFVSLVGAMALMLSSFLVKSILARITVPDDQLSAYWNTWIMPETFDSLMFCAISYHNSYRTAVLFWPDRQRYPLMIATAVVTVELALHIAAIIVIQINLLTYHTLIRDSLTQKLSLALIAYVSTVDSFFFALTQWRVISVMQDLHKARAPRLQYADAVLRGVCFSGAIFLYFASLSGLFFDPNEGL